MSSVKKQKKRNVGLSAKTLKSEKSFRDKFDQVSNGRFDPK
jgi:hypothetical protein